MGLISNPREINPNIFKTSEPLQVLFLRPQYFLSLFLVETKSEYSPEIDLSRASLTSWS